MIFLLGVLPGVATAGSLTDNGNGTVTDSGTLLMWQQGEGGAMTWEAALTYCEGLVLPSSGYSDWRLPNHKELLSLVDDTRYNPSINTTIFSAAFSLNYWSSTTYAYTPYAWIVYFFYGSSDSYDKTDTYYARCVRGGQ
jgi:hypothetical protein